MLAFPAPRPAPRGAGFFLPGLRCWRFKSSKLALHLSAQRHSLAFVARKLAGGAWGVLGSLLPCLICSKGAAAPVRAGVDGRSHRVGCGVCVVNLRAVFLIAAALIASAVLSPVKLGAGGPANAADAVPPQRPDDVKVPEFVPVVNFSQFVLAVQTFATENPPASRIAAEALSAKFAADQAVQPAVVKSDVRTVSVIVTRPVAIARVTTEEQAQSEPNFPIAPDPSTPPQTEAADPVKVARAVAIEGKATGERHKQKAATSSAARSTRHLEPAMGLGMTIDSAEAAPPMSSLVQKKSAASHQ